MKNTKKRRTTVRERVIITTLITMMIVLLSIASYIDTHYNRVAIVDKIEDNTITFCDTVGYTWDAVDVENVVVGQKVVLKMYTNNTVDRITDDVIVGIKTTPIRMK